MITPLCHAGINRSRQDMKSYMHAKCECVCVQVQVNCLRQLLTQGHDPKRINSSHESAKSSLSISLGAKTKKNTWIRDSHPVTSYMLPSACLMCIVLHNLYGSPLISRVLLEFLALHRRKQRLRESQ